MYNILVWDDDHDIVNALTIYLSAEGYQVIPAYTGAQALEALDKHKIHLALMDIMMPEMDGIAATAKLRERSNLPIILLTAKSEDTDKVLGLNMGADDYITKPFNLSVVYAKTMALIRRSRGSVRAGDRMALDGLALSLSAQKVYLEGQDIPLTPKEYALLHTLMSHRGQVLSREQLLRHGWGYDYQGDDRAVDTHIRRLREKLGPWANHIRTVIKAGYRLEG